MSIFHLQDQVLKSQISGTFTDTPASSNVYAIYLFFATC